MNTLRDTHTAKHTHRHTHTKRHTHMHQHTYAHCFGDLYVVKDFDILLLMNQRSLAHGPVDKAMQMTHGET